MAPTGLIHFSPRQIRSGPFIFSTDEAALIDARSGQPNGTQAVLYPMDIESDETFHQTSPFGPGVLAGVGIAAALFMLASIAFVIFLVRRFRLRLERRRWHSPDYHVSHSDHTQGMLFEKQAEQPPPLPINNSVLTFRTALHNWCPRLSKLTPFRRTSSSSVPCLAHPASTLPLSPEERGSEVTTICPQSCRLLGTRVAYDAFRGIGHGRAHPQEARRDSAPASTPLAVQFTLPAGANQSYSSFAEGESELTHPLRAQRLLPSCEQDWTCSSEPRQLAEQPEEYRRSFRPCTGARATNSSAMAVPDLATMPIPGPYLQAPPLLATFPWRLRSPRPTSSSTYLNSGARGPSYSTLYTSASVGGERRPAKSPPLVGILAPSVGTPNILTVKAEHDQHLQASQRSSKLHPMWCDKGGRLRPCQSESPIASHSKLMDGGQASTRRTTSASAPGEPRSLAPLPASGPRVHFRTQGASEHTDLLLQNGARTEAPKSPYVFWRDEDGNVSIPIQIAPGGRTRSSSAGSKFVEHFSDACERSGVDTKDATATRASTQGEEGVESFASQGLGLSPNLSGSQGGGLSMAVTSLEDLEDSWYAAVQSFHSIDDIADGDLASSRRSGLPGSHRAGDA